MTLLRRLATTRTPTNTQIESRYDPEEQVSYVLEDGHWVRSLESRAMPDTKKADMETGEDQKGQ